MKTAKFLALALIFFGSGAAAAENNLGIKVVYEEPSSMALDEIQPGKTIGIHSKGCSLLDSENISDVSMELECSYFLKPDSKFHVTVQEFTLQGTHVGAKDLAKGLLKLPVIICAYKGKEDALNSCVFTKEIFADLLSRKKSK